MSELLDLALVRHFEAGRGNLPVALIALGSYGRQELCPGSDVDVLLVHAVRGKSRAGVRELAEQCWYPLWDAGFVTGHATRTIKESLALADEDIDALTALVQVRHLAGDESLTSALTDKSRQLAFRRGSRMLRQLADASDLRRYKPGAVAEMLEPDLKEGAGGLRDIHALDWAGFALGVDGIAGLRQRAFLDADDTARLDVANDHLLDLRVALHRLTNGRSDRLALQEQDAVADEVGAEDADALVRQLAGHAREVAWIARDVWLRVNDHLAGPSGRQGNRDRPLAEGVVVRDGRVAFTDGGSITALRALEAASAAAELDIPFERASLGRLRDMAEPTWDVWERAAFMRLLRGGERAVAVFEALDHEGALVRLFPEWAHVRFRPQRNAYHRFTVDRHLLEAVAECATLLDAAEAPDPGFDGIVARACRRPELLLLGALLHDIAKGMPGDHSEVGSNTALDVARRIGLDSEGREIVSWIVRNHLLMADVATRRDLADAAVADNVAAACSYDAERLRLLYLLTIGDSRATGSAAWSPSKAALVRDLFVKAAAAIEHGAAASVATTRREELIEKIGEERAAALLGRLPETYVLAFDVADMLTHEELLQSEIAIRCHEDQSTVLISVVARDRPRLLASIAGAITIAGLDVLEANLFGTTDGIALDVFRAGDPYGRVADGGAGPVESLLRDALGGDLDIERRVADRRRNYRSAGAPTGQVKVEIDVHASPTDTVVEVHADDDVGLLYRLASALADRGLDVRVAKAATLGQRVVDVFYVRDANGDKLTDPRALEQLRGALVTLLTA